MPNKSSKRGHLPIRSCVICKKKEKKKKLFRLLSIGRQLVFDLDQKFQARGVYVCDKNECIKKYIKIFRKKRRKLNG